MCYIPLPVPDTRWIALVRGEGRDSGSWEGGDRRIILQIILPVSPENTLALFFRRTTKIFRTAGRMAGVGNAPAEAKFFDGTALPNMVMGLRSSGLRRHRVYKNLPGGGGSPRLSLEFSVHDEGTVTGDGM